MGCGKTKCLVVRCAPRLTRRCDVGTNPTTIVSSQLLNQQAPGEAAGRQGLALTVDMGLEEELNALMAGASVAADEAKTAQKKAVKTRRKSKDLEETLSSMTEGAKKDAKDVKTLMKDSTPEEIFEKIDKNKSGTLDVDEFQSAFKELLDKEKTKDEIFEMMKGILEEQKCDVPTSADDPKCKINLEQFKKLVTDDK